MSEQPPMKKNQHRKRNMMMSVKHPRDTERHPQPTLLLAIVILLKI
jgi:hypothetical protein